MYHAMSVCLHVPCACLQEAATQARKPLANSAIILQMAVSQASHFALNVFSSSPLLLALCGQRAEQFISRAFWASCFLVGICFYRFVVCNQPDVAISQTHLHGCRVGLNCVCSWTSFLGQTKCFPPLMCAPMHACRSTAGRWQRQRPCLTPLLRQTPKIWAR